MRFGGERWNMANEDSGCCRDGSCHSDPSPHADVDRDAVLYSVC